MIMVLLVFLQIPELQVVLPGSLNRTESPAISGTSTVTWLFDYDTLLACFDQP